MADTLDGNHASNFTAMIRSLNLSPSLAISGSSDIAQAAARVGSYPRIGIGAKGAADEAAAFTDIAYGAVLSLVYFRALDVQARDTWDRQVRKWTREGLQSANDAAAAKRKANEQLMGYRPPSSAIDAYRAGHEAEMLGFRKMDFFRTLNTKKMSVFPDNGDEKVNDPNTVAVNPWCQSDTEFVQGWKQEKGTHPQAIPSFWYGFGDSNTPAAEKQLEGVLTSTLQAEFIKFMDKFLEMGVEVLKGCIKTGVSLLLKLPIVDVAVDWLKDFLARLALENLVRSYEVDHERRIWLTSVNWGTYKDPDNSQAARRPALTDMMSQVR